LLASFPSYFGESDVQIELLQIEIKKINDARLHIDSLRGSNLGSIPNDTLCNEDAPLEEAVAWVLEQSGSKSDNNEADFLRLISGYVHGDQDLTDQHVLDEIHDGLVPQMRMNFRHIVPLANTLSSVSGSILFQFHLQRLHKEPVNAEVLGEHLFAGIVGYHPYPDGNGRTARAVYAIDKLRKQAFQPLSLIREHVLSGLPPNNPDDARTFLPAVPLQ
jgi:hypothetical protein